MSGREVGPREAGGLTPPHDIQAEQCTLGGMLLSKDAISDVVETIRPDDHYRPAHQIVHEAILELYGRGEPADPVTVADLLGKRGELGRIGGPAYLHTLIAAVPTAANAGYYARIVRERAICRRLIEAGTRIVQLGYSQDAENVEDKVERAAAEVDGILSGRVSAPLATSIGLLLETMDAIEGERPEVLPLGLADLDAALGGGGRRGQVGIVAARTAMGKTLAASGFAETLGQNHHGVYFTLEMSARQLMYRRISRRAGVSLHDIRRHDVQEGDWVKITQRAADYLGRSKLRTDDAALLGLAQIKARVRSMKRAGEDPAFIVVDLVGLMQTPPGVGRYASRQEAVAAVSRGLKLLAKEEDILVLGVVQLNRGPESRADHRPQLSDLRESGQLEQDADWVILLHREDYYDRDSPRAGEVDLILAKHRDGPTCTITAAFQGHFSRIVGMAPEDVADDPDWSPSRMAEDNENPAAA